MSKFEADNIGNTLIKVDGNIKFKLNEVLEKSSLNKYRLSKITNIRYDTICNYCKGNWTLINVEYRKIFCSVLNCEIEELIEYKD